MSTTTSGTALVCSDSRRCSVQRRVKGRTIADREWRRELRSGATMRTATGRHVGGSHVDDRARVAWHGEVSR